MVSMAKVAKQYREKELMSSSPEKIVLKLYDAAIGFIISAITNIKKNDISKKAKLLAKAVDIIVYLRSCLDLEKGEIISENLNRLYEYILVELAEGNMKNDAIKIEKTAELLSTIRDGWVELCENKKETNEQIPAEFTQKIPKNRGLIMANQNAESFTAVA